MKVFMKVAAGLAAAAFLATGAFFYLTPTPLWTNASLGDYLLAHEGENKARTNWYTAKAMHVEDPSGIPFLLRAKDSLVRSVIADFILADPDAALKELVRAGSAQDPELRARAVNWAAALEGGCEDGSWPLPTGGVLVLGTELCASLKLD